MPSRLYRHDIVPDQVAREHRFQFLPDLAPEEYAELKADIQAHGIQVPIIVDDDGKVIDGHHRVKIAEELGLSYDTETRSDLTDDQKQDMAIRLNIHRRHLTRHQRAELVGRLRSEGKSVRQIAGILGADKNTVMSDLKKGQEVSEFQTPKPKTIKGRDGKTYSVEPKSRTLTCEACDKKFTQVGRGRPAKRCPDCRSAKKLAAVTTPEPKPKEQAESVAFQVGTCICSNCGNIHVPKKQRTAA